MSQSISLDLWKRYAKVWHNAKAVDEAPEQSPLATSLMAQKAMGLARQPEEDMRTKLGLDEEPDEDTTLLIATLMGK